MKRITMTIAAHNLFCEGRGQGRLARNVHGVGLHGHGVSRFDYILINNVLTCGEIAALSLIGQGTMLILT